MACSYVSLIWKKNKKGQRSYGFATLAKKNFQFLDEWQKFSRRNDKTYAFIPRDVNFNGDKQTASNAWLWKDDYLAPL